ncbi:MAG: HPr family phosphocarrier protein [Clostridiales bacterium]|jgi:phosphocarrier protein|nr:HPr family phosphocarrier protein [Clostridiales bacterium]
MVSEKIIVKNKSGLHLRPAGVFVKYASNCKSDIKVVFGEKKLEAKSILNIMAAGIKCGTEIEIVCTGETEEADLVTMINAIESGLGE